MDAHERARDKLFVALDTLDLDDARDLVRRLAPLVGGFKVGMPIVAAGWHPGVIQEIQHAERKAFLDLKLLDLPEVVARAVRAVIPFKVDHLTLHCEGRIRMMRTASEAARAAAAEQGIKPPKLLGVTVMTSLGAEDVSHADLAAMGANIDAREFFKRVSLDLKTPTGTERIQRGLIELVRDRAGWAKEANLDGVVVSAREAREIRLFCDRNFIVATPGIRPCWAQRDDQRRVATPADAVASDADILIVGRPITSPPPEIGTPEAAAERILEEIAGAL